MAVSPPGTREVRREPSEEIDALARAVIGAAIEVHRMLGPGFLESVYEEAMVIELWLRSIPFERQKNVSIDYKGHQVGEGRFDLLVGDCLVVEIKAVEGMASVHAAQVMSYLRTIQQPHGLLINFNVPILRDGIKRVVLTDHLVDPGK